MEQTVTVLTAVCLYNPEEQGNPQEDEGNPSTSGTAVFNLPNGDTLSIIWDLNLKTHSMPQPTILPSSDAYYITGISNPVNNNGTYEFTLVISSSN
jgi:hypothetical protein